MKKGSSPDEGVPEKGSEHRGIGPPIMVGVGYTQRELCDGQSLASPRRWPPGSRVLPNFSPNVIHDLRITTVQRSCLFHWLRARSLSVLSLPKKFPFSIENFLVSRLKTVSG